MVVRISKCSEQLGERVAKQFKTKYSYKIDMTLSQLYKLQVYR